MAHPWFGVSTSAFFPRDLPAIASLLRAQPLRHVELMPQAPQECNPSFSKILRDSLGESFLVSSIHFPLVLHHFLADPYPAARAFARQLCRNLAELAESLGARTIIVHGPPRGMVGPDFLTVSQENIGYLADHCRRYGVTVALENTVGGVTETAIAIQSWIQTINRANVACCLDVGHAHRCGQDPILMARDLPNLVHIHVHGFHPDLGDHRTLQDGIVNWTDLSHQVQARDYQGGIVLELKPETLGDNPPQTLQRDVEFLLQVFHWATG